MRCYVASPLGFTAAGRHWYADVLLPALAPLVEVVDPWTLATPEEVEAGAGSREFWLSLGARNAEAIRSCSLMVALLDGQELDSGTAAEVGFGAALGLCCFGLRTDLRQHGEDGVHVNLQVEHFIVASGGAVVTTVEELLAALAARAARG
jgi:nucleoside 2-deoxyribosyltransferase